MTRYAMVADLDRCVGCQTCTAACRHANATSPAVQWRKVLDIELGAYPDVSRIFVPVGCQHCEDPPCMHVCPTTATRKRPDGIVTIDYDICIGCAYCDVACPYQARFKVSAPRFAYGASPMQSEALRDDPRRIGVAQKCTFCADRIDAGLASGLIPGVDAAATPACVNSCIADALSFGDADDPDSKVSRLLRDQLHFRMHEELGTAPNFHYLYDRHTRRPAGAPEAGPASGSGHLHARGVESWHQQHWDWKAAANFLCGGAGSGLLVLATAMVPARGPFVALALAALVLIALGLSVLMLKIGRPLRFLYVFRQPQRSWMSREAWIAAFLFPLALLALWFDSARMAGGAALLALLFLISQAMMVHASRGIPAWRSPRVVGLMVTTGLAEGAGLLAVFAAALASLGPVVYEPAVVLVALVAIRGLAWRRYLGGLEAVGAPLRTLNVLGRFGRHFLAWGIAVPLALGGLCLVVPQAGEPLLALAGLTALASGWAMKFVLITRAGYNQGYALHRVEASGLAGPAIRPGWSAPAARLQ